MSDPYIHATKTPGIYATANANPSPYLTLAANILHDALCAVRNNEPGAELFFYGRFGDRLAAGLGLDITVIRDVLGLPEDLPYPQCVTVKSQKTSEGVTVMDTIVELEKLAAEMKSTAAENYKQPIRVELSGGLALTLTYSLSEWRLSLSRPDGRITAREKEICRRHFGAGAATSETVNKNINGVTWNIVRLTWPNTRQINFLEAADGGMIAVPAGRDAAYADGEQ